ncbi:MULTISPECIES: type III secretion system cytoplasmic ring protein SctQ [unclassified Variovorax]|uniref:type III secretion system cytoplasmic ring protein SctQ n=1 Tax=unclassified Variovorax TaxID=663243 RepID=UPI00076C7699|nr:MULTISPECIES: type III secretion system cytoplasmic ring protein SctQ [unclassified Variovorax]KWT98725.1 Type III secretion inner membrane protein (YscQ,homologous to flagellar export components) [Variovorax sp. WDL1]PNG56212.1 Yop proteins translocation protein Q [Variovorax sp. B4]PNG57636.1 Yop proteins translocation protein Q [Variovorax sp. B2]VTV09946.1 Yop proteins translocation protein Q [Variovorax sp. WDL1]
MPAQAAEPVTELGEARALPRAEPANVRALNRLYGAAPPGELVARDVRYRLSWRHETGPVPMVRESFRFRLGAHVGHLGLDAPSLQSLLGERRLDLLPRELRYILLADALHRVADALEKALRLHFEWQPQEGPDAVAPPCDAERAAFFEATAVEGGAALRGFVQFDDGGTLDALVPADAERHAVRASIVFDALRLPVHFAIGSTPIQLREINSIRAGDIVGIEQWSSSGGAIVVTAALGGSGGRQLTAFAEGSRITVQQTRDSAMKTDSPAPTADASVNLPIDRLDALEVTLRFEVGELSLSLGELKSIRAGHVFELGQPLNRSPVRILAHGNVLGKGYLVAVGDRLGVRVSEFAPGEV